MEEMKGEEDMAEQMNFPETVEEFMNYYKITDTDKTLSNGVDFVPVFRMQQWFEHEKQSNITIPIIQWERMLKDLEDLNKKVMKYEEMVERAKVDEQVCREEIAHLKGMIEGLQFATRCNGVSGAEVKR